MRLGLVSGILVSATLLTGGWAVAQPPLADTRSTLEQWFEANQLISKTKTDWRADKELLERTIDLHERELQAIEEQMSGISTNNTQVEKERLETEATLAASQEALDAARTFASGFEAAIQKLVPRLPGPLRDILKKDLARIPADPVNTRMLAAERMQILVGLLNEMDKFNNALNVFSERRKNTNGEEIAVETVYVGLGAAYFVNESGDFAGMGSPGPDGWEWNIKPELAPTVREVLMVYRSERTAQFITLPVVIR